MQYLITGGSGFIGKRLAKRLLDSGHGVTYTGRTQSRGMDSRAAYFHWDGQSVPPLDSMGRLDGVFHLAGEPVAQRWNEQVKQRIRNSRVGSTHQLVAALGALRHKPPTLVCASAIGFYGERGNETLTESSSPGTGFLADVCKQWEAAAQQAKPLGLRVVPVRISIVLGTDGGALPPMLKVFRTGMGGKLGNGEQWMSWIHVDDLVRLLAFAMENPAVTSVLNGASPSPVRNLEFTSTLGATLHRPAVLAVPVFALRLAMGEMADSVVASARVVPQAAQALGFPFEFARLQPCLQSLIEGGKD